MYMGAGDPGEQSSLFCLYTSLGLKSGKVASPYIFCVAGCPSIATIVLIVILPFRVTLLVDTPSRVLQCGQHNSGIQISRAIAGILCHTSVWATATSSHSHFMFSPVCTIDTGGGGGGRYIDEGLLK